MQEAKGSYKIAIAELENKEEPSARHLRNVAFAKANSAFKVAKEKCDDTAGNAKSVCKAEARSTHKSALADANKM